MEKSLIRNLKWILIVFFIKNTAFAENFSVSLEKINKEKLIELYEKFPRADVSSYRDMVVQYDSNEYSHIIRTGGVKTVVKYNETLTCNNVNYPTVMLQIDGSYEKASLSLTSIANRLYIFEKEFNLIEKDESLYWSVEDDFSPLQVKSEHHFTLDNVEQYACEKIKTILNPAIVEKAFSSKKTYNEYSIDKIQAMFDAYPLSKRNVTQYNNIAYYFEKHKAYEQSVFILEKILDQYPSRTVAYINLGDAYWALAQKDKAKTAYEKYVELMKADGKEQKIPKTVLERI